MRDDLFEGSPLPTVKQARESLQRFIDGKQTMCVPAQHTDDDLVIARLIGEHYYEVDFDALERVAKDHVDHGRWEFRSVSIDGDVSRMGMTWTITVRARSDGGQNRYVWIRGLTLRGAVERAMKHLQGPFKGWVIVDREGMIVE